MPESWLEYGNTGENLDLIIFSGLHVWTSAVHLVENNPLRIQVKLRYLELHSVVQRIV